MADRGGSDELDEIEAALGFAFADVSLLQQALTHPASGTGAASLERLEFLGDRVLGLALAGMLYRRFPAEAPGDLARRHAALAGGRTLDRVGRSIGLHRHLKTDPRAFARPDDLPSSMVEDALEAVIGAVYLDAGHDAATAVVERFLAPLAAGAPPRDAKSALQEWAQGRGLPLPVYRVTGCEGPDHEPTFAVEVAVEGFPAVESRGASKRAAEFAAAEALLAIVDGGGRL